MSSDDDDVYVFQIGNKSNTYPVLINDTEINVIIDSGSIINILDENSFHSIIPQPKLEKSSTKIYPYQSDSPLQLLAKGNYGSLLGKQTATALDLLHVGPPKVTATINVPSDYKPPST